MRSLLTRDYLGFTQPATTDRSRLATPTPTATVIVDTGAAFGGLPAAFVAGLDHTHTVVEQHGAIECVDLRLTPLGVPTRRATSGSSAPTGPRRTRSGR